MEIKPVENLKEFSLPLPIYQTVHVADAVNKGEEFKILIGLDHELVDQLKKYSADESDVELQKFTQDKKRYVVGTYEEWYSKKRTPFALIHIKTGALVALMRFGPDPLEGEVGNWHTVGWRSYKPFRGVGIMKEFSKYTFDFYLKYFPDARFWITAKKENSGSIGLASYLGFKVDEEKSKMYEKDDALFMIKEV